MQGIGDSGIRSRWDLLTCKEKETGLHDNRVQLKGQEVMGYGLDWGWAAQDKDLIVAKGTYY